MPGKLLNLACRLAMLLAVVRIGAAFGDEKPQPPPALAMADVVRQYQADEQSVHAAFRLPASDAALNEMQKLETRWSKRLRDLDFQRLDQSGRVDYLLLGNEIQRRLDEIARQRQRIAELDPLLGFRDTILELEQARRRARPMDASAAAGKLDALAQQVKQVRERVEKASKPKSSDAQPAAKDAPGKTAPAGKAAAGDRLVVAPALALRGAEVVQELQATLDGWFKCYSGALPGFDWWVKRPYEEAHKQLDDYAKLLREEVAAQKGKPEDALVGQPIGPEAIAADIRREFLPYTADELIAIGEHELAWCEGQMREASRQMGLGDDWKAALARVKADHVPPGGQDGLVAQIGREAAAFVQQRKLVTVPPLCLETWRLTMMSPEQLKTIPYAAYSGQNMLVAYAQQSMNQDDKLMVMRGNNRHFMRLVTPHELIPGHHLQGFYAARYNTHRDLFNTPFYVEGWALYWELRLWDLGWAKTPQDRMGMLFWRMTRAARIIVSLKYHLGRMQPEEMVEFLVSRVGHEKFGATSEVRRFIRAAPLYQAAYMIGGLQFLALHDVLVGPGKMTEGAFHDKVLEAGPMPIAMLRADLLKLPLGPDTRPAWRFADDRLRP